MSWMFLCLFSCFPLQYYYSVRIFAGQEPSGVWIGWVTPYYHQYDPNFDLTKVRSVTVTVGDDRGNIHDRLVFKTQREFLKKGSVLLVCGHKVR